MVRASSGGMELHPMHQEEELGTRSSLYSSSTVSRHLAEYTSRASNFRCKRWQQTKGVRVVSFLGAVHF